MRTGIRRKYIVALAALLCAIFLSLFLGLDLNHGALLIRELRIPRLILGLGVGAGLSLAGLVLQTVLTNPLAEPYTLGIASGAAFGAAVGVSLHAASWIPGVNPGALLGAGLGVLLLSRTGGAARHAAGESVILVGVMLSLLFASLLSIWMSMADPLGVQSVNFWLLGDLSRAGTAQASLLLILVLLAGAGFFVFSRNLDAFLFGEDLVESFGVSRLRTRKISILVASVLTALCVSLAGMIGFVGLMVPHLVRRWLGVQRHFHLIPFSLICGATLLVTGDSLARAVGNPHELPVGAVTSLAGAPVFLFLFLGKRRGGLV
jgi:iron complex transport system permease protein